jgi:hypothetical protein
MRSRQGAHHFRGWLPFAYTACSRSARSFADCGCFVTASAASDSDLFQAKFQVLCIHSRYVAHPCSDFWREVVSHSHEERALTAARSEQAHVAPLRMSNAEQLCLGLCFKEPDPIRRAMGFYNSDHRPRQGRTYPCPHEAHGYGQGNAAHGVLFPR